eukprot:TRINITY_DN2937_c1_g1_i2.p1 TRINITY_DN2937_c1_g1~~TRINITY_DN2937_c1_g1_i2.p1  ORF type:complete len:375 (-),score=106.16 TRINITY_DN2937_c1_g1_i2:25-1149(-)
MVKTLLVIGSQKIDFHAIFKDQKLSFDGEPIRVEQAPWELISVTSYSDSGAVVTIDPHPNPIPFTNQGTRRTVTVDFVLFRGGTRGTFHQDFRNLLLALMYVNVPSINSLQAFYDCQEKPLLYRKLLQVQKRLGTLEFPLIPQTFHPDHKAMYFLPEFPVVVKVGTASGGVGKMKLMDQSQWNDFRGLVSQGNTYVTSEPYIEWDYDIRIQKIGAHYRAMKRIVASKESGWKSNDSACVKDEDVPVTPEYRRWIDEACAALDLDIAAIDAVYSSKQGRYYILEINGSSIGLAARHAQEDAAHIRDLVMHRMDTLFSSAPATTEKRSPSSSSTSSATAPSTSPPSSSSSSSPSDKSSTDDNKGKHTGLVAKLFKK